MSFWKWIFGGGGDDGGNGDDPKKKKPVDPSAIGAPKKKKKKKKPAGPIANTAPPKPVAEPAPATVARPVSLPPASGHDQTVAWVEKRLAGLQPKENAAHITEQGANVALQQLFEAKRVLAGRRGPTMLWGLAVTEDFAPWLFQHVPAQIDALIAAWEKRLEGLHGLVGRQFVAEARVAAGFEPGDVAPRHGKRARTFAPPPAIDEAAGEREAMLAEASSEGILTGTGREARIAASHEPGMDVNEVLEALVLSDRGPVLERLTLGLWGDLGEHDYAAALDVLSAHAARLAKLEELFVGDFEYPDETEISWTHVGDVGAVIRALPGLKRLRVRGAGIELGKKLAHPRLERVVIETGGLPKAAVGAIARAELPELRELEVWFGHPDYGAEGDLETFRPFFAGQGTPKLEVLGLKNADFSDDLAEALVSSPLAARIRELDMGKGTLTDRGGAALAAAVERFTALEHFDLDHCYLSDAGVAKLEEAFGDRIDIGEVLEADEDGDESYYYVAVGE